jgi:hypothetical protein
LALKYLSPNGVSKCLEMVLRFRILFIKFGAAGYEEKEWFDLVHGHQIERDSF